MSRLAITGARLLDPASGLDTPGAVLVEDGRIAALGADISLPEGVERIEARGHILCPGLVDAMAWRYDGRSAVAGGITRLALMPDQDPVLDNEAMITHANRHTGGLAKVHALGAATKRLDGRDMAELGLMAQAGAVAFSNGRSPVTHAGLMRQLLAYAGHFGRPIFQTAEAPDLAAGGVMTEGETATRLGLPGAPATAELIQVERDCRLAELTHAAVHFPLLSTAAAIDVVRQAKARGVPVSAGTAPPYFTLNETAVGDYRTFAKLAPPLRTEPDREAVVAGLADGTLSVIISAHDPKDEESKRLPFSEAAFGAVGFETLLPLTLALHHQAGLPLMVLLRALTAAPAQLLGLEAGRLSPGAPADLLLFDPDRPGRIDATRFVSQTRNTPFDGMPVQGGVVLTVIDGRIAWRAEAAW